MSEKQSFNLKALIEKFKKNKFLQYLIIILLLIIAVFVFFGDLFQNENDENLTNDTVSAYVESLENRLTNALKKVDGAGNVTVVINVKSGMQTVLATEKTVTESTSGKETVETPIIINGKTVVLKELYPEISGVLIVSEGADNIAVCTKIQQATMSLLDIKINQIEILSMK